MAVPSTEAITVHYAENHEVHLRWLPIAKKDSNCTEHLSMPRNSMVHVTLHRNVFFISTLARTGSPCAAFAMMGPALWSRLASNSGPCPCSRGSSYLRVLELSYIQEYKCQYRKLRHNIENIRKVPSGDHKMAQQEKALAKHI